MGKPPTTDQELQARVAALEQRADATDAAIASLHADLDVTNADVSMLIDRTDALDARVTALEGGTDPPAEIVDPPPVVTPPTTGRAATITLDGTNHLFTQEGGTDLGAYTDPKGQFVQHCIAARCATLPDFTIMFRPDAEGGREEVVFEFGRCLGAPAGSTLGAYMATITKDGETLATIEVPKHYYYSRWRWQSAARPVRTTAAELIEAKLVPPYDAALAPTLKQTSWPFTYAGPMDLAGITAYMPTTGERVDIGVCTEMQAQYLMYEDEPSRGAIMAWLEAAGTWDWHYRDETTMAPIDFVNTYPLVSSYWNPGGCTPILPCNYQTEQTADTAHIPDLAYVPFLLTGDPYALEEIQFEATGDYCRQSAYKEYCMPFALRGYAWHIRNAAHAFVATPDNVPSWLLPKATWQTYMDRGLAYTMGIGPDMPEGSWQHRFQDLSVATNSQGEISAFMEEYTMAVFLHVIDLGFTEWDPVVAWKCKGIEARTNGTSGYNRSVPIAYIRQVRAGTDTAPVLEDWAALFAFNSAPTAYGGGVYYSPNDPTQAHLAVGTISWDYVQKTAACVNWAARQGRPGMEACQAWLSPEIAGHWEALRWTIA